MVKLYSNHCPRCKILESKLKGKNIQYEEMNDIDRMLEMGIMSVPVLEVEGIRMDFTAAVSWVNGRK